MSVVYVKGRKIDQDQLKTFLAGVDFDTCEQEDGTWRSPISGQIFATKSAMYGSFGTYLRTPTLKDPTEPTRKGYIRAIRAGYSPTEAQKKAHADYMRALRAKKKEHAAVTSERLEAIAQAEPVRDMQERRREERKDRVKARRIQADEAYAESLKQLLP